VLAKWLNINAKVYIFDEPTRGIDVLTKSEIHKIIQDLASKGAGVIVISSELPEILALSNRVLVMREGILSAILVGGDISEKNIMQNAIIGENRIDTINRQEV
jgi:ABC-type sugar transport system ATPase subunit